MRNILILVMILAAGAVAISAQGDTPVLPAKITKEYKGKEVGFCCKKCAGKWDGMSDAEKDAALANKG